MQKMQKMYKYEMNLDFYYENINKLVKNDEFCDDKMKR